VPARPSGRTGTTHASRHAARRGPYGGAELGAPVASTVARRRTLRDVIGRGRLNISLGAERPTDCRRARVAGGRVSGYGAVGPKLASPD
jgi:hypothetical protein